MNPRRKVKNNEETIGVQDKLEIYEKLLDITRLVASSVDIPTVQKKVSPVIKKLLNCDYVNISLYDGQVNKLKYYVGKADHLVDVDENTFLGTCALKHAQIHATDIKNDLRLAREPNIVKELNPSSMALAPCIMNGSLIGVLKVVHKSRKEFSDSQLEVLNLVVEQLTPNLENILLYEKLNDQFIQIIQALGDAISKKDQYTGGHTKRVGIFSEMIAKELDLSAQEIIEVRLAAVLHDIGKIGIEDKILKKQAPLTEDEFKIMREHPRLGYEILGHIDSLKNVVDGIRFHHERQDGGGYPYGMKGDEIPRLSQIISVADTFDAMISTRPYRKGLPPMVAYQEILENAGTQFSDEVVGAFKKGFEKTNMYRPDKVVEKKKAS